MKNRLLRAIVMAACLLGFAATAFAQSNPQWDALDSYIKTAMHDAKVPGMAVGIVQNGQPVYVKGFGMRDITTGQPVTPDTLFDIGSCTKAFTAGAVGILVDEGKMHWDDRVGEYIPFFHLYDPLADENVTMRDLLTHRTGMAGTDLLWYGASFSPEEIIRRVRYIKPEFGFRAKFEYQNVMYATAGYAVGMASGGTWQDFVRAHIFTPLGMTGADFSATDAQQATDHATPHNLKDGQPVTIPWRNIDNVAPAGSINAGVKDMAKWIAMQLNDGKANEQQLISAKSLQEMHTPQIIVPQGGEFELFFAKFLQLSYGMGWFIGDYGGHQIWMHPGDIDGFASLVVLLPDEKTGFVILTNQDHTPVRSALGWHLIDEFLQQPAQDWMAHFTKIADQFSVMEKSAEESERNPKHPNTHPSRELAAYVGTYQNKAYGEVEVSQNGDRLQLRFNSFRGGLTHFQYDAFDADLGGLGTARVLFSLDEDGDVSKATIDGIEFERTGAREQ